MNQHRGESSLVCYSPTVMHAGLDSISRKMYAKKTATDKYEEDVIKGKIPCPFTCRHVWYDKHETENPVPIRRNGKPKIKV